MTDESVGQGQPTPKVPSTDQLFCCDPQRKLQLLCGFFVRCLRAVSNATRLVPVDPLLASRLLSVAASQLSHEEQADG